MKATVVGIALAAYASLSSAMPTQQTNSTPSPATSSIQVLPADVHGPNIHALSSAPTTLPGNLRSFLKRYQPLANNASDQIGTKEQAIFTSAGHCFAEFPCFSVERGAMATIGESEEVTQDQVSAIIDHLRTSPTVAFTQNTTTLLSELQLTKNQATLQVIAAQGSMPADFLAGMIFDMYKMQHDDPATNSIRAVQAATDGKERPFVALCLYPEGADAVQARNFCLGNELDGRPSSLSQSKTKRFSIETSFNFLCGMVKIPIICHDNKL